MKPIFWSGGSVLAGAIRRWRTGEFDASSRARLRLSEKRSALIMIARVPSMSAPFMMKLGADAASEEGAAATAGPASDAAPISSAPKNARQVIDSIPFSPGGEGATDGRG